MMKKVRLTTIMVMAFLSLVAQSCKDSKKEKSHKHSNHSEMDHSKMDHSKTATPANTASSDNQSSDNQKVLADYMQLKDALVATDKDKAAAAGKKIESTLKAYDVNSYTAAQQKELNDIIEDATEHAEHISKSGIGHQREHFKTLSKDIIDLLAITGTKSTLYQQFCPMYNGGSAWLSMNEKVRNPYYGNKMLTCGKVQKTIN